MQFVQKCTTFLRGSEGRKEITWIAVLLFLLTFTPRLLPTEFVESLYHAVNPNWLIHDFYVQTLNGYHHQYFTAELFGVLATVFPVEKVLAFGALVSLLACFGVLYFGLKKVWGEAAEAVVLLVALPPLFVIGGWSLLLPFFRPWLFAQPFILYALIATWREKPLQVAVAVGVGSWFHPLLGGVVGGVCLLSLLQREKKWLGAVLLFGALFSVNVIPVLMGEGGRTEHFIEILAQYRHAIHYIPTATASFQYKQAFWMVVACGLCYPYVKDRLPRPFVITGCLFFILVGCGYLFVEIYPMRWVTTLIGLRYTSYLYLMGLVVIGLYWNKRDKMEVLCEIIALTVVHRPLIFCLVWVACRFLPKRAVLATVLMLGLFFLYRDGCWVNLIAMGALIGVIFSEYWSFVYARGVCLGLLALLAVQAYRVDWDTKLGKEVERLTDAKAVLVTPIEAEHLRVTANRALVASYSFPFLEKHFESWYERASQVWGEKPLPNNEYYRQLSDTDLLALKEKYGATHALLFRESATHYPILFENERYRLVSIND